MKLNKPVNHTIDFDNPEHKKLLLEIQVKFICAALQNPALVSKIQDIENLDWPTYNLVRDGVLMNYFPHTPDSLKRMQAWKE